jgi:hypothetical protein
MPAVWTDPATWEVGQLITADDLNEQIRDELLWLLNRPSAIQLVNEASNYTTTSTSFVDVDSTDLSKTVNIKSGIARVTFICTIGNNIAASVARVYLDIAVDGARIGGDDGLVFAGFKGANAEDKPFCIDVVATGLSVGDHTFKVQWKTQSDTATMYAGAGTASADVHPFFSVHDRG